MRAYPVAVLLTMLALTPPALPQSKLSKNHIAVRLTKAIDSTEAASWQVTGQVKNSATIGKATIPAGSDAVVALVPDDFSGWRLSLLSVTVDGSAIPVNSTVSVPGKNSPMTSLNTALQKLATQRRGVTDADGDPMRRQEQIRPRVFIPPGDELVFLVTAKQLILN